MLERLYTSIPRVVVGTFGHHECVTCESLLIFGHHGSAFRKLRLHNRRGNQPSAMRSEPAPKLFEVAFRCRNECGSDDS